MKRRSVAQLISLAMAGGAATLAPLAAAQSASTIEEITVTARRTEESIQSVPVSVTAFDAAAIREAQISTPEDLQISTPGVYLSGSGGRQNVIYQIRGQSKSVAGQASAAVVSYFAEVPDPVWGSFVPQYDIASVQVLKGPQGTLFGRNTTGGAVLYAPTEPGYEFGGYVSGALGNFDKRQFQGAVNIPLVADKVALRVAGDLHRRDGWVKNIGVGGDAEAVDTDSFRVSLLVEPVDGFKNLTIYDHFTSDNDGFSNTIGYVSPGFNLLTLLGIQDSALARLAEQRGRDFHTIDTSLAPSESLDRSGITNRTEIDFGAVQLVNIFGYRHTDLSYVTNTDGLGPLFGNGNPYPVGLPLHYIKANNNQEIEHYSNEIQLKGQALGDKLDWMVGAFWLDSEPDGSQGYTVLFGEVIGFPVARASYTFTSEESRAIFANLKYDLDAVAEGLEFEVGIRYTEDEVDSCTGIGLTDWSGDATASDCRPGSTKIANVNTVTGEFDETTWSVGLNWQVTEDIFTYGVARHGYRAGGANGPTLAGRLAPFQIFEPETVTDFEVGVRADWMIGGVGVRTNLSAFFGKYDDVQTPLTGVSSAITGCDPNSSNNPLPISVDGDCDITNDPAGGTLLVNSGKSEVSGVDLELIVTPTDRLTLNLGANYLDLQTKEFGGDPAIAPFFPGNEIPFNYTAEKSLVAGVRYAVPLDNRLARELVSNLDYYWTDDIFYILDVGSIPSYELVNLRIDLNGVAGTGLDISAFARNLTDEEYYSNGSAAGAFIGISSYVLAPPRLYGMEVRYSF